MLTWLAEIVQVRLIKVGLIVLGAAGTVLLLPLAVLGSYFGANAVIFYRHAPDVAMGYTYGLVGLGGILGLTAAWVRVIAPNRIFQASKSIFWCTVIGLIIGIATGSALLHSTEGDPTHPLLWVYLVVSLLGVGLLGATIGARKMRPNPALNTDAVRPQRAG